MGSGCVVAVCDTAFSQCHAGLQVGAFAISVYSFIACTRFPPLSSAALAMRCCRSCLHAFSFTMLAYGCLLAERQRAAVATDALLGHPIQLAQAQIPEPFDRSLRESSLLRLPTAPYGFVFLMRWWSWVLVPKASLPSNCSVKAPIVVIGPRRRIVI